MILPQYILTVGISDHGEPEYTDTGTITVDIAIVNDPPVFSNLPAEVSVPENVVDEVRYKVSFKG